MIVKLGIIYGIKEAGREWSRRPCQTPVVEDVGLAQCETGPRVLKMKGYGDVRAILILHVDDN